jgi:hypothetical protein
LLVCLFTRGDQRAACETVQWSLSRADCNDNNADNNNNNNNKERKSRWGHDLLPLPDYESLLFPVKASEMMMLLTLVETP